MNVDYSALPFWRRARECTDSDLDPGYRLDMVENIRHRNFSPAINPHARRWADRIEARLTREYEEKIIA